jgi:hypothetical protein
MLGMLYDCTWLLRSLWDMCNPLGKILFAIPFAPLWILIGCLFKEP